jgi:hypothetical protein
MGATSVAPARPAIARLAAARPEIGQFQPHLHEDTTMTGFTRRQVLRSATAATLITTTATAFAQTKPATPTKDASMTSLFKIITVKDDIVIGLSAEELSELGGQDAGAVARALVAKSTLSVWQYAVRKATNGDLEQAPLRKVGLIAHDSLRVEPMTTPLKVIPHA